MRIVVLLGLCLPLMAGCLAKDATTNTPNYHVGTPTNRSSVNSWELNNSPFYTQPGVNNGKPVTLKPIASQRGFEPYDPLAERVYAAWSAANGLDIKYLSAAAKGSVVILTGTVALPAQRTQAEDIARKAPGVTQVVDKITVRAAAS